MAEQLPDGWRRASLGQLGTLATSSVDKLTADSEQRVNLVNYMDVYSRRFIDRSMQLQLVTASKDEVVRFQVQKGDILFTPSSETPDDIGHSAVVVDDLPDTVHSYHTVRLRVQEDAELDLRFRGWVANNEEVRRYLAQCATGSTRYTLSLGRLGSAVVALPPFVQQHRIAEILWTVDEAIEGTEKLIAKHQQIKAGLMHDLFTRGLTPDGRLRPACSEDPHLYKDSPLGPIPKEWEVLPLEMVTAKIADRDHTTPRYVEHGVLMVSPTNLVDDEEIDFAGCKRIREADHRTNRKKTDIRSGDLILHRIGAGLGAVRLVTDDMPEFSILHSMAQIRPLVSRANPVFLVWAFRQPTTLAQMGLGTQSIGVPDLGLDKIANLQFPIPTSFEQSRIVRPLQSLTAHIAQERKGLRKLKSLKRGLMHDLLTGEVSVAIPEAEDHG